MKAPPEQFKSRRRPIPTETDVRLLTEVRDALYHKMMALGLIPGTKPQPPVTCNHGAIWTECDLCSKKTQTPAVTPPLADVESTLIVG